MTDVALFFEVFRFLRPWLLLLIPVTAVLWWWVRRGATLGDAPVEALAPHLRAALTVGGGQRRRFLPIDGVALTMICAALGSAGPTWSRVPDPFVAQTAPLVIALKVTPSMEANDVLPMRLERAKQKIRDLLDLRSGARTALVAYAGSAHSVVPMTEDPAVLQPFLEGLSPEIMPEDGADTMAALALARDILGREDTPGGILFVADGIDTSEVTEMTATPEASLGILAMLPDGTGDRGLDSLGIPVVQVTPDDADVRQLDRRLNAAYRRALAEDGTQPWDDRGWLLAWPAALLTLIWFRRGWTMKWLVFGLACGLGLAPTGQASADGIVDWFLTADQQGWRAFQDRDFSRAADLYADPLWKGYALYRAGRYDQAVATLDRVETAQAAFIQGMAHIKFRQYRDGVRSFELALQRDPDYPNASENLEVARQIVVYVEETREASDTGEEQGIGADDIVMDNESGAGAETQIEGDEGAGELLTAEQWMNTVDTQTSDFLRQRFAIEAARGSVLPRRDGEGGEAAE